MTNNIIKQYSKNLVSIVIGFNDAIWGKIAVAVIETKNTQDLIEKIKKYCANEIPKYMIPKYFKRIGKITKKNNEIDYQAIRQYIQDTLE